MIKKTSEIQFTKPKANETSAEIAFTAAITPQSQNFRFREDKGPSFSLESRANRDSLCNEHTYNGPRAKAV